MARTPIGSFLYFVARVGLGKVCYLEFRKLTFANYDEIIRLWRSAGLPFKLSGRDSRESVAKQMKVEPDFFIGAFNDDHMIGVAVMSSDMRRGWINRLAVNPDSRHGGVGKALVQECERVLKAHGLRLFCALIEDTNITSKKLFKSCGYVEHEDIKYLSKRENDYV